MSQLERFAFIIAPGVGILMVSFLISLKVAADLHSDNYLPMILVLLLIITALMGVFYYFTLFVFVFILPPILGIISRAIDKVCLMVFGRGYRALKIKAIRKFTRKREGQTATKETWIKDETVSVVAENIAECDNQNNTLSEFEKCCREPQKADKIEETIRKLLEEEENKASSLALIITCAMKTGLVKENFKKTYIIRYFGVDQNTFYTYMKRYTEKEPDEEWSKYIDQKEIQVAKRYKEEFEKLMKSM